MGEIKSTHKVVVRIKLLKTVVLKLQHASASPGGLLNQMAEPHPQALGVRQVRRKAYKSALLTSSQRVLMLVNYILRSTDLKKIIKELRTVPVVL